MLTDAHCHPFDLKDVLPDAEEERRRLGVFCAASASSSQEFMYNEDLSHRAFSDKASGILPCFAIHPQLPAVKINSENKTDNELKCGLEADLETLENFAASGRLAAVGETGFDLYDAAFRETEAIQDELFAAHLETALRHELPVIIHVRRAMHKVFAAAKVLVKCKSVIFHSWPGTIDEGEALLKRGVNAYFSFGAVIMLNHKKAMRCAALFPAEKLLTETDAPYQAPRNQEFSCWTDLPRIVESIAALRRDADSSCANTEELESRIESNFRAAFFKRSLFPGV